MTCSVLHDNGPLSAVSMHFMHPSSQANIAHVRHTVLGAVHNFVASALALPTGIITTVFLTWKLGPAAAVC